MEIELHFVESCANCEYGILTGGSNTPCKKHNIVSSKRLKCVDFKRQKKIDFTKIIYLTEGTKSVEVRRALRHYTELFGED